MRRPMMPWGAWALAVGAVLWESVGRLWGVDFLPPISGVMLRLGEMVVSGEVLTELGSSLMNLLIGAGVAVVVGVAVGVLMGLYPKVNASLEVYVYALFTAPPLVFAPVFFSMFGLSRAAVVAVIVMYAVFIITLNTAAAVRTTPRSVIEMAQSFSAPRHKVVRRIVLPAAMPGIMAGLRIGLGRAVEGMINGEMFIAVIGIGALVRDAGRAFDAETILAVVAITIGVALAATQAIQWIDRTVNAWLPSTSRQ